MPCPVCSRPITEAVKKATMREVARGRKASRQFELVRVFLEMTHHDRSKCRLQQNPDYAARLLRTL
jgi:hypothetical protein